MKQIFSILTIILFSATVALGERVSSDCTAPDSVVAKYKTDAERIALSRIYWFNAAEKLNAMIPATWTDTILRALIAVYNAPLPKTDTVDGATVNLMDIHGRPYQAGDTFAFSMNSFAFTVDTSRQWVKELRNNIFPTSDAQVNAFFTKYNVKTADFSVYMIYGFLTLGANYNTPVVSKEWAQLNGVYSVESSFVAGDGNYLVVPQITNDFIDVVYSYGYGDCPSGCINRRNWLYRVYFDCDVEFMETWEGYLRMTPPPPNNIPDCFSEGLTVFPNPFTDNINLPVDAEYKIISMMGNTVKSGTSVNGRVEQLQNLPTGVYILSLYSNGTAENIRILKK